FWFFGFGARPWRIRRRSFGKVSTEPKWNRAARDRLLRPGPTGPLYSAEYANGPTVLQAPSVLAPSMSSRHRDEANVSTQQPAPEEDARVQAQDANPRRPPHPGPSPRQGPGE